MLRSYLVVAGMAATALGLLTSVNCGGESSNTGGGGSGTGAGGTATTTTTGGGASGPGINPPPPGDPKAPDGTGSVTFAVSKLYLGDTKFSGATDSSAWKDFGYDLDNRISTATSTDLCKPRDNTAPKNVYPDGNNGIDNSFGKNILPIITSLASDASSQLNDSIAQGSFTLMLDMEKLGTGDSYNPMVTQLYAGANFGDANAGAAPKFDGTDKWPVVPELLNDPNDITKGSKVQFPTSYLTGNTWVSGSKGNLTLSLSIAGFTLNLTIGNAVITGEVSPDHKHIKNGIIAGVLPTDSLISELKKVAGAFDPSLCSGTTIDSIASQIAQASDILLDGSQDPTKSCDGISIGLGFEAELVLVGDVAAAAQPQPDPCSPP